jgi:hypothetical protein
MALQFANDHVACVVRPQPDGTLQVDGEVKGASSYVAMEVLAPHPIDRRTGYHGSGLPFPCPGFALENTPNYVLADRNGRFRATFSFPNSYYTQDARTKVGPSIFFRLWRTPESEPVVVRFELPEPPELFVRTLTHRPSRAFGPAFYSDKDTILDPIPGSAEHVMRALKEYKAAHDRA